jgi:hypothetical protein
MTFASRTAAVLALVGALLAVGGWLAYRREHARAETLAQQRTALCTRVASDLATTLAWSAQGSRDDSQDLHVLARRHFLDPQISLMCLGSESPVETKEAAACWVKTQDEQCWRDVLRVLHDRYDMLRR